MAANRITIAQALHQASAARGYLRSKGFTYSGAGGELRYTRNDADLRFEQSAGRWVCDVYTTQDNQRLALLTRKAAPMLLNVLKSII